MRVTCWAQLSMNSFFRLRRRLHWRLSIEGLFTTSAADSIPCDTLILETTYGVPFYTFPDLTVTCSEIVEWALQQIRTGKIPVFRAYSGGKAQEIVKIFNVMTRIPVIAEGL